MTQPQFQRYRRWLPLAGAFLCGFVCGFVVYGVVWAYVALLRWGIGV